MKTILVLVASVGKNVELGDKIAAEIRAQDAQAEIVNLVELELPLYSTKAEANGIPEKANDRGQRHLLRGP